VLHFIQDKPETAKTLEIKGKNEKNQEYVKKMKNPVACL
jgi:hypothetical protein